MQPIFQDTDNPKGAKSKPATSKGETSASETFIEMIMVEQAAMIHLYQRGLTEKAIVIQLPQKDEPKTKTSIPPRGMDRHIDIQEKMMLEEIHSHNLRK